MRRGAVTIVSEIKGDKQTEHAARLEGLEKASASSRLSRALSPDGEAQRQSLDRLLESVHFFSAFVIPRQEDCPAYAVLEINHDGSRRELLHRLADAGRPLVHLVFEGCEGFPGPAGASEKRADLEAFLTRHDIGADVFYVGCPGRSVGQIRVEQRVRALARRTLEKIRGSDARAVFRQLRERLAWDVAPDELRPARRPRHVRYGLHGDGLPARLGNGLRRIGFIALAIAAVYGLAALLAAPRLGLLGVLLLLLAASAALILYERPKHFVGAARRALGASQLRALGRSAFGALLLVGALSALSCLGLGTPDWAWQVEAVRIGSRALLGLSILLALGPVLVLTVVGYVLGGRLAGVLVATAGIGLWASVTWAAMGSWTTHLLWLAAATGVATATVGVAFGWLLLYARRSELEHREGPPIPDPKHLEAVQKHEHRAGSVQTHLATVSRIRSSPRSLRLLAIALRGVSLLVWLRLNRGERSGVPAIHFARFVRLPDRRRLLFLSNYDGAFGPYLSAFRSVPGVTAIWAQTLGFPRAYFLTGGGARNTPLFKEVARHDQVPTQLWYSAYPELRVGAIDAATRLRERIARPLPLELESGWAARLQRTFRHPLTEAECDLAWREI